MVDLIHLKHFLFKKSFLLTIYLILIYLWVNIIIPTINVMLKSYMLDKSVTNNNIGDF